MVIRKLTAADYDVLWQLWNACAGMGLNDLDDSKEGISRYLTRNPEISFGAFEGKLLIGAILAGHDGRRGYFYHLAVLPEYRHRGVGGTLVDRAACALRECGIHKIALVVFERNKAGNTFWEHHGFSLRNDLCYRNKTLTEMFRIDT